MTCSEVLNRMNKGAKAGSAWTGDTQFPSTPPEYSRTTSTSKAFLIDLVDYSGEDPIQ